MANVAKFRKQARLPFATPHENRDGTAAKDQRYRNCYVDVIKTVVSDEKKLFLTKRPGISSYSTTTSGSARGVWDFKGSIYHVTGTTLYRDNISIKTLTTGITTPCGAVAVLAPQEKLFLCDGFTAWLISPDGTIVDIEQSFSRWAANTVYAIWDRAIPTAYASQTDWYYVTTAGTTGATEPTWGGSTVTSGTVTFTKVTGYTGAKRYTNRAYTLGDLVQPNTETALYYKVVVAGTTSVEPSWSQIIGSITTSGGVQFECMGYYGGFPSPHLPMPAYLDGYVFLVSANTADIYNSRTTYPWSWNGLEFISADSFSGPIVSFARYNNYLAAFGENNIELFYDAANPTGSPLKRHDSFILQTGTIAPYAIIQSEMMLAWVGTSNLGGITVWLLNGFDPNEVGTSNINRILAAETDPTAIRGYGIRIDGHLFFLLNLPTANKTLILDISTTLWYEWSIGSNKFPFDFYTDHNQTAVVQHADGKLYNLLKSNYKDTINSTIYDILYSIITTKVDFDNRDRKFIHAVDLIGDLNASNVTIQWSDDDYQTWSTVHTVSLATRPRVTQCGSTRRRAFKIEHIADTPCRLENLDITFTQGSS